MKYSKNVKKQEATVPVRNFKLQLSDSDVKELFAKSGKVGLTPDELLSNFVYDLICGTYTNGSDERMYAEQWFDRCAFSYSRNSSFLSFLLCNEILDYYLELRKDISDYQNEISVMEISEFDSREEYDEEIKYFKERIESANEEMQEMFDDYCSYNFEHKSIADEIKIIEDYLKRLDAALSEN